MTIYLTHDNPLSLYVLSNRRNKSKPLPEDLSGVTRAVVRLDLVEPALDDHDLAAIEEGLQEETDPVILDSDVLGYGPGLPFNWLDSGERGLLICLFGAEDIPVGIYEGRLVLYGSFAGMGVPNGFVVADGLQIQVEPETMPLPAGN